MLRRSALLLIVSLFFSFDALAQRETKTMGLAVSSVFSEEDQGMSLKRRVLNTFERAQDQLGIPRDGDYRMTVYFDVMEANVDGEKQIIMSVTSTHNLHPAIVSWAGESEAFYLQFASNEPLAPEGREVRQYMSRDWFKQLVQVSDQRMVIFPEEEMESTILNLISEITKAKN